MEKPLDLYKSEYQIYLESESFGEIRKRIAQRDNNRCKICGSTDQLETHHLTYEHIYQERDYELICLCHKCHETYHTIENYKKYADRKNAEESEAETKEKEDTKNSKIFDYEEQIREERRLAKEVEEYIKENYYLQDYAKDGPLDMCSWSVLNPIIEKECQLRGIGAYCVEKMKLMKWFQCRRYELLLRCIDKGYSLKQVKEGTKFDPNWLNKWYYKNLLLPRLEEEKIINSIKEDSNNAET